MRTLDILRRSMRSLMAARGRTILTALAIAVGAFALTLTLGASNGAQQYADILVKDNFDPSELIVTAPGGILDTGDSSKPQVYSPNSSSVLSAAGSSRQVKTLSDTDIERLRGINGVESVRPLNTLSLQYVTRDGQRKYAGTVQAYSNYKKPDLLAGSINGTLTDKTIVIPEGMLQSLGFSSATDAIGKTVRLAVQKQYSQSAILSSLTSGDLSKAASTLGAGQAQTSSETNFTVVAVNKPSTTLIQPGTALYMDISDADLTKLTDYTTEGTTSYHKYFSAYVKVSQGDDQAKLSAAQLLIKKAGYSAQSVLDTQKIITQVITVLQGIVTVFGLIAVVASVFGVVNTMYISVLQRTREIGLMKALGMRKRDISKLFLFEAGLIGFLGGALGVSLAVILGTALNPSISNWLSLGGARLIEFQLVQIVALVAALTAIAIIAGLLPARKAAKLDPIVALRTE